MGIEHTEKRLTPEEAANYLHLTKGTLNNWRCAGKGPKYLKIGGIVQYKQESLDEFIEGCERG